MWPFRRQKPDENLLQRVQSLEAQVAELKREYKAITVEWDDWFGKYRRLYAQISKRVKQEEEAPEMPQNRKTPPEQGEMPFTTSNPAAARLLAGGMNGLLPR